VGWHGIAGVGDARIPDGVGEIDVSERFRDASWETLIGLTRSSGDSASAASSTLREAQPEYRMCMRASWAVMCVYFYIACRCVQHYAPRRRVRSRRSQ